MPRSRFLAAFVFATASRLVGAVIGTPANDTLFFVGLPQLVNRTITNAYSGAQYKLNGSYNVNTETYDGLAGVDTLLLTFAAELLELNLGGSSSVANVERIVAGDAADVIDLSHASWLLGAVLIDGGRANDVIWSNAGNDTLNGSDGDDWLDGGPGNDILRGQNDNDYLYGGDGDDDLGGGLGINYLFGGSGRDFSSYGLRSNYELVRLGPDMYRISSLIEIRTDYLQGVEWVRFAGGGPVIDIELDTLPIAVPEPGTLEFGALGLIAAAACRRKRRLGVKAAS